MPSPERSRLVAGAARRWSDSLVDDSGRNQLAYYRDLKAGTLRLDDARPAALTMLMAGRQVMLKQLFPEAAAHIEALRRAKAYETAGADIIFVESPESEAELEKIGKEVEKPLLANMVEFGKTPRVEVDRLKKWGFDVAIYPGLGFSVAAEAMRQSWEFLKEKGTSNGIALPQYRNMHELMGFSEVWDFEKKWAS